MKEERIKPIEQLTLEPFERGKSYVFYSSMGTLQLLTLGIARSLYRDWKVSPVSHIGQLCRPALFLLLSGKCASHNVARSPDAYVEGVSVVWVAPKWEASAIKTLPKPFRFMADGTNFMHGGSICYLPKLRR